MFGVQLKISSWRLRAVFVTAFLALSLVGFRGFGVGMDFGGTQAAFAVEPGEILKDPKLEARARDISSKLRCLVCQNQSIDDSNAPLAHDLRLLVRERLTSGDSDKEIFAYVVARYGTYVLLKPPFNVNTLLLWLAPLLILLGGIFMLFKNYRGRMDIVAHPVIDALSDEEQAELDAILARSSDDGAVDQDKS